MTSIDSLRESYSKFRKELSKRAGYPAPASIVGPREFAIKALVDFIFVFSIVLVLVIDTFFAVNDLKGHLVFLGDRVLSFVPTFLGFEAFWVIAIMNPAAKKRLDLERK